MFNKKTLLLGSSSLLFSFASPAVGLESCQPLPDCAQLGYQKNIGTCSSFLICPFDTSYKICLDCNQKEYVKSTCADYDLYDAVDLERLKSDTCENPESCECATVIKKTEAGTIITCYNSPCTETSSICTDKGYVSEEDLWALKTEKCADPSKCFCQSISTDPEINAAGAHCYNSCIDVVLTEEQCINKYGRGRDCNLNDPNCDCDCAISSKVLNTNDYECREYIVDCGCRGSGAS